MVKKQRSRGSNNGISTGKTLTELNEDKKKMDAARQKRLGFK